MLWIILLYRKCLHQAIHYSSFGTFFTNLCGSYFFFFCLSKKVWKAYFYIWKCIQSLWRKSLSSGNMVLSSFPFSTAVSLFSVFDVVSGTLKASKPISALVCQQFNIPSHHASTYSWKLGLGSRWGGGWGVRNILNYIPAQPNFQFWNQQHSS